MKRRALLITALVAVIATAGVAMYAAFRDFGIGNDASPYAFPQQAVSEKLSPDGNYKAKVLYDGRTQNYFFAVEGVDGTQLILTKSFVPSTGYHDPRVSLSWKNAETVVVTVDHDFGEGDLRYEFNIKRLSFKRTSSKSALLTDPLPSVLRASSGAAKRGC